MDQEEINNKYEQVKHWLEMLVHDDIIPQYEVNEETITCLHRMCEHNKEMNHDSKLLLDDINMKHDEYKAEASRMKDTLEGVGLPISALSNAGKSSLKMLTELASVLDIKDVKKSSYMMALHDFSSQLSNVMVEVSQKQANINSQISQVKLALKNLGSMSTYYQKLAEHSAVNIPLTEKRKKDTEKMEMKSKTYKQQIIEDEKNMQINSIEKKLHHANLVRLSEELKSLQEELKPLQTKYQNYRSLPPDIYSAKVKIEETKRYMDSLDRELQTDIDYLAM